MENKRRKEITAEISVINEKCRLLSAIENEEQEKGMDGVDMVASCLAEKVRLNFEKVKLIHELMRGQAL